MKNLKRRVQFWVIKTYWSWKMWLAERELRKAIREVKQEMAKSQQK